MKHSHLFSTLMLFCNMDLFLINTERKKDFEYIYINSRFENGTKFKKSLFKMLLL